MAMKILTRITFGITAMTLLAINVHAAGITPGDVVVVQVGNGSGVLSGNTAPVFLDEYTQSGAFVQQIAMPTSQVGGNLGLTMAGTGTAEGDLTLSPDGQFLALTGFNFAPGVISPATTNSSVVARSVGLVATVDGSIDTTTGMTGDGASDPRGAVTLDGNSIWEANGTSGIVYTTDGTVGSGTRIVTPGTSSPATGTVPSNDRRVNIFNGQLYMSDSSLTGYRLSTVGVGTPTTAGQTLVNLPGYPTNTVATGTGANGGGVYSFLFLSEGGGTNNVLYVTDAQNAFTTTNFDGLLKFSLVGGVWTNNGFIPVGNFGGSNNVSGLSGYADGTGAHLFFTAGGGFNAAGPGATQTNLDLYVDSAGYNAAPVGSVTTIASAGANEVFRGVVVLPEPSTYALVGAGLLGLLTMRRRRRS